MKKVNFVIGGIVLTALLAILYSNDLKYSYCGEDRFLCLQKFNLAFIILLFGPALLISALIARKVSDGTFNAWKQITYYFIVAYVVIIILMPWSVGDEIAGFTKGMVGLVLCIGYTLFSVVYLLKNRQRI